MSMPQSESSSMWYLRKDDAPVFTAWAVRPPPTFAPEPKFPLPPEVDNPERILDLQTGDEPPKGQRPFWEGPRNTGPVWPPHQIDDIKSPQAEWERKERETERLQALREELERKKVLHDIDLTLHE